MISLVGRVDPLRLRCAASTNFWSRAEMNPVREENGVNVSKKKVGTGTEGVRGRENKEDVNIERDGR